jgi:hypothetical protein
VEALQQVLVLFLLIVVGYTIKMRGVVTEAIEKEVSSLVLNIALPAFLLRSMAFKFSIDALFNSGYLVLISFVVYGICILLSKVFSRLLGLQAEEKNVSEYVMVFSNVGYMGYPVIFAVLGEEGVFFAALYNLSFNLLVWTYGISLLQKGGQVIEEKTSLLKSIFNPGLIAILIGYFLFLTGLKFPPFIDKTLDLIGGTTTPLSMMFIGFILTEVPLKAILRNYKSLIISIIRLVIIPMGVYSVLTQFGLTGYMLKIPVIITAMPAAANTAIFASRFGGDYRYGSQLIFVSTLLSIGTIPLILFLLGQ